MEVFHKQKKYKILIDRGSRESTSQFSEDQIKYIIKPILSNYIQRLEYVFFSDHADHGLCIRQNEEIEDIDKVQQDYSEFIGRALSDIRHTKGRDDINNTDDYARAIVIARMIILYTRNKNPPISDGLFGQIDRVL